MDTVEYLPTARDGLVLTTSDESEPPIDAADLIRDGLREDASHLIPTEVRGKDAKDVIHAWTTGHSGNCTMHTGTVRMACDRLAQMVGQGGIRMDTLQMRWIAQAIHFVVQIKARKGEDRVHRRVTDIVKVMGYDEQTGFKVEPVTGAEDVVAFMRDRSGSL
jgi:Flp pilus assembly CpaF family ATPase